MGSKQRLYYTPPTEEQFNELKEKTIEIWNTYDNEFGYVDEKVNSIKDIKNIQDNFIYMVAMFDIVNQRNLADKLSDETRQAVRERLINGGQPEYLINF
ncbi:hypothetical protein LCGC14_1750410 [marine sediment metagenome]|uniref:Uncharacterized protein n=1 Tax=marine sediment metagenome TaxID=412755 RepID=A0A0F9H433_9ZZZZ